MSQLLAAPEDLGPRGAPMLGGVRMMWPGMAPLVSGMPGRRPGEAGMPMYFRARSSIPVTMCTCEAISHRTHC